MCTVKPNLFIVGAPKCGTSALAEYLNQHPQVFICSPKEPFYWSSDFPLLQDRHSMDSLDRYLELFREATAQHRVVGEGSTNYLRSIHAIPQILDFNPDARFIAMLRNPVDVVHAFHAELLYNFIEDESDFETAWRLQEDRKQGNAIPVRCEAPQLLQYAESGLFSRQISRFFDIVPRSQRQVIIFDDFKANTRDVFDQTLQFLGLDAFSKESFERVNAAHVHRSPLLAKLVFDPPRPLRPIVNTVRRAARRYKFTWIESFKDWLRRPEKRCPLSPEFRMELANYFAPDVEYLSTLLDRDLTHWVNSQPMSDGTQSGATNVNSTPELLKAT